MVAGIQGGNCILRALKWYKELEKSINRKQLGYFIVEGKRAIEQIAVTLPSAIDEIIISDDYQIGHLESVAPHRVLSVSQLHSICSMKTSQGIIAIVKIPSLSYSDKLPTEPGKKILLLEDVQDPGNVGALIRTAAAFDFSGVILTKNSADPFSSKAVQASAGALLSLWIRRVDAYLNCIDQLKLKGYQLIATSAKGTGINEFSLNDIVIALGNEGVGLSDDVLSRSDYLVRIPINDKNVESLNVAISGALVMYSTISQK